MPCRNTLNSCIDLQLRLTYLTNVCNVCKNKWFKRVFNNTNITTDTYILCTFEITDVCENSSTLGIMGITQAYPYKVKYLVQQNGEQLILY